MFVCPAFTAQPDQITELVFQPIPSYPGGAANQECCLQWQKINRWKSALISDTLAADEADGQ